ncbi:MAG: OmpA family protein [Desulfobacterales bacterium]|nr:MAG: OmpA family protein [Desulfobacterales bacterium]
MQHKSHLIVMIFSLMLIMILMPACAKMVAQTAPPDKASQEDDTAERARLEEERLQKEAQERELRAAKIKFMYEDIYFTNGSYALTPEAKEILMRKAEWLRAHSDISVIIEGHTDERGSKEYNFALGDRRAGAVKSFLLKEGIATERLIAVSCGQEKPIDPAKTKTAREKNRRVHFVIE